MISLVTAKIYLPSADDPDPQRDGILTGHVPFFIGNDDEHLACSACKAVLARNTSTRYLYERMSTTSGRLLLQCDCGTYGLVRVQQANRPNKPDDPS